MPPSNWLYDFLREHEAFRPTAYRPTRRDRWTIGYGHTNGVKYGDTCTMAQAIYWLRSVDTAWASVAVDDYVSVPLTQNQYDALCSFVFNVGEHQFAESHLLVLLNERKYSLAADEFLRWDHQAGHELEGLKRRREAERTHFLEADNGKN